MLREIGFVLADPARYLLLCLCRVFDYFEFWPTSDTTLLYNMGRVVSFGFSLPFMLYGLLAAGRQAGSLRTRGDWLLFSITPLALAFLFIILYSLLHILTWAMPRYQLPVDAVAVVFAAHWPCMTWPGDYAASYPLLGMRFLVSRSAFQTPPASPQTLHVGPCLDVNSGGMNVAQCGYGSCDVSVCVSRPPSPATCLLVAVASSRGPTESKHAA